MYHKTRANIVKLEIKKKEESYQSIISNLAEKFHIIEEVKQVISILT
ncbi:BhlA/UviB family holin-like peptide [Tepidibacter sp.]